MIENQGTLTRQDDRATVRFERWLDAVIEDVWAALTTPDGLEAWLAPTKVDLRPGGAMDIDFGEDGLAGGIILELEPPNLLEYEWGFPGEPDSILRFELTSRDDGTMLVLEHRLLPTNQSVGYSAGWHAHLDHLDAVVTGREPGSWDERFNELLPIYS